jgi:hypothetical protein
MGESMKPYVLYKVALNDVVAQRYGHDPATLC